MIDFRMILLMILLAAMTLPVSGQNQQFKLAVDGRAEVAIVLDQNAPIADRTAAKELSFYLNRITGGVFNVYQPENAPRNMPRILLGQTPQTTKALGNIDWNTLKYDGIVIKFVGRDLILAGDQPRGTLYAVYTFLEDYLGVEWWTGSAYKYPFKSTLAVDVKNKIHVPPFMYRETYYYAVNHRNRDFNAKMKLNGFHQSVPNDYGGHYTLIGFVHTFDRIIPVPMYYKDHPEWFSLRDGKRVGGQIEGQLCLSNEEMKKEFIQNVLMMIATDPAAGMVAVDQNDNFNYCQCENCTAIANEEGGQSGLLIRFVNDVADAVKEKYPNFLVETLAYQYTRHAPKLVKPRDNVIVRLCSIECDFLTPLDSKNNESFYKDLVDWKKISKRLYIWDYVVNFANLTLPFPNFRALGPNLNIFAENNVIGMFEQGDGFNNDASFANMKIWVMAHLMWDRTLDPDKLMNEFANGYYGAAGPYIMKYLNVIHDAAQKHKIYLGCFVGSNVEYLKQSDMDRANKLFDDAELAVKNDAELLRRVRLERLALDHAWILQPELDRRNVGKARNMDLLQICEDLIATSQATRNDYINEGLRTPQGYYDSLRFYATMPYVPASNYKAAVPDAVKGMKADQWVDTQESRWSLYKAGPRSSIVADTDASDNRAIRMPADQANWAAQVVPDRTNIPFGTKVEVHLVVKVDSKATSGDAFTAGIHSFIRGYNLVEKTIKIEEIPGTGYQDYNLGTVKMEPGWFVYVATPGDSSLVENIFVDRGYLIKK